MILRCVHSYTTPEGQQFTAGELYELEAEQALWLLSAAEGQFRVEETEKLAGHNNAAEVSTTSTRPRAGLEALSRPPADQQISSPPVGGTPRSTKRGR